MEAKNVSIYFSIEIDFEAYRAEFAEPNAKDAEIREYVKAAAEAAARSELERLVVRR